MAFPLDKVPIFPLNEGGRVSPRHSLQIRGVRSNRAHEDPFSPFRTGFLWRNALSRASGGRRGAKWWAGRAPSCGRPRTCRAPWPGCPASESPEAGLSMATTNQRIPVGSPQVGLQLVLILLTTQVNGITGLGMCHPEPTDGETNCFHLNSSQAKRGH